MSTLQFNSIEYNQSLRAVFYARRLHDGSGERGDDRLPGGRPRAASRRRPVGHRTEDAFHRRWVQRLDADPSQVGTVARSGLGRWGRPAVCFVPGPPVRKHSYQMLLMEELEHCGVEVVFLDYESRNTPEDKLLVQMQGVVAEYERTKIMERSRRGKLHLGCVGAWSASSALRCMDIATCRRCRLRRRRSTTFNSNTPQWSGRSFSGSASSV